MKTWDVRLLAATYVQEGEDTVMELYGRTREGKSITILSRGFKPYFYIIDPTPAAETKIKLDREVISTERDTLLYLGEQKDVLKITVKYPFKMSDYRNKARKDGFTILSADIPFHLRFIYDLDLGHVSKS